MTLTWGRTHLFFIVFALVAIPVAGCATGGGADDPSMSDDGDGKDDDPDGEAPDGETPGFECPGEPCDLYDQCGCEANQACDLNTDELATGGTACRPIETAGMSQANCDTSADCAAGYGCFGTPGQCRKYCEADGDCGSGSCIISVVYDAGDGDWQSVPDAELCTKPCKPESAQGSGCPSDPQLGCNFLYHDPNGAPDSGDEYWYTDCRPAGNGGDAADCSANGDADCQPGFGCFNITYTDESVKQECRQICVYSIGDEPGGRACSTGECNAMGGDGVWVGDVEYGVCL